MGKTNVAVNRWLADNERFADLFNGFMFHGKQIIQRDIGISLKDGRRI